MARIATDLHSEFAVYAIVSTLCAICRRERAPLKECMGNVLEEMRYMRGMMKQR